MPRSLRLCPAVVATLALAAIGPKAFCFQPTKLRGELVPNVPLVAFQQSDASDATCFGALVSSTDVLTTNECAEKLKSDVSKVKAVLGAKEAALSCQDTNPDGTLAMIRLDAPLCDKQAPATMFQPGEAAPKLGDTCNVFYMTCDKTKPTGDLRQVEVTITPCADSKSKRKIRGSDSKSDEKLCATLPDPTLQLPLPYVLTCQSDHLRVVGLGRAPPNAITLLVTSTVGVDKESWYSLQGKSCPAASGVSTPTELGTCPVTTLGTTTASPPTTVTTTISSTDPPSTAPTASTADPTTATVSPAASSSPSPSAAGLAAARLPAGAAGLLCAAAVLLLLVQPLWMV